MSKTLEQRIDAGEIKAGDITHPDKGMTFYIDGYGEFQFQFPAPCWLSCDEDEQNEGMGRLTFDKLLDDVACLGKVADAVKNLNHTSPRDRMTVLVELYRRLDAYIQYWMWVMGDSSEVMFDLLSKVIASDNPDINKSSEDDLGDLLSAIFGGNR